MDSTITRSLNKAVDGGRLTPDEGAGTQRSTFSATASLGLAFYPSKDVASPEHLVKYADEALYRAKREGRNCICLYHGQTYRYDVTAPR